MIWRCLMDRTCCVATPKGPLISCSADAGVLTQGMGASPADKRQAANRIKAILNDLALLENSTCYVRRIKAR